MDEIEIELNKTIAMMEKMGYEISYEIMKTWKHIHFSYKEGQHCAITLFFDEITQKISQTQFTVLCECSAFIRQKIMNEYGFTFFDSYLTDGDLLAPITFLQTQKIRLLLNK